MRVVSVDIGWRNLAFVKMDVYGESYDIIEWKLVDIIDDESVNVNKTSLEDLVTLTAEKFSKVVHDWDCEVCYLELQPMGQMARNVKTKTLSHIFQSILLSKGIRVKFVSPKLKLQGLEAATYAANKKFAVDAAYKILGESSWKSVLDDAKKKDDLADAFMQGLFAARADLKPKTAKRPRQPSVKKDRHAIATESAILDLTPATNKECLPST
jgi:hypothetical protein